MRGRVDMERVALRKATQEDSGFAFEVKKVALGEYIRETYGWDEEEQRRLHEQRFRPSATSVKLGVLVNYRKKGGGVRVPSLHAVLRALGDWLVFRQLLAN